MWTGCDMLYFWPSTMRLHSLEIYSDEYTVFGCIVATFAATNPPPLSEGETVSRLTFTRSAQVVGANIFHYI